MYKKLKQELKTAFSSPAPTKKEEFLSKLPYPKTRFLDFFFSQIWYIRKRFWCLSALIAIALFLLLQVIDTSLKSITVLSGCLPFFVVLSFAEISKSISYNMAEMEMCCRYNLGKITLVRVSLIGSFHFIIIFCMVIIYAGSSEYSFLQFYLYSMVPFLLCSYLSLYLANHFYTKDILYICAGVAGFVSISVFLITNNYEMIYQQKYIKYWGIIIVFTVILLTIEIKNLMNRTEELQWNSPLIN